MEKTRTAYSVSKRMHYHILASSGPSNSSINIIEKAKELLKETPYHGITQIGYEIGFGGLRNFETHFKQLTGQTPYQYRKKVIGRRAISFAKRAI